MLQSIPIYEWVKSKLIVIGDTFRKKKHLVVNKEMQTEPKISSPVLQRENEVKIRLQ